MTIYDRIRDEKLQYDINREATKISPLSSGKLINMNFLQVRKCYLQIKEEWLNKLSLHSPPQKKTFEKQTKTIEEQEKKQIGPLKNLDAEKYQKLNPIEGYFSKEKRNNEIKNEIDEIKKWENEIK